MRLSALIMSVLLSVITISAAAPRWEAVDVPAHAHAAVAPDPGSSDKVEVAAGDGYIYIVTPRPVAVKVFTILGQLVSSESVPAGHHRLRISTKGIYIVKIGTATHRVIL